MCKEKQTRLCGDKECEICNKRRFSLHSKSKYWITEKNNGENPFFLISGSNKAYWFHCEECGHDIQQKLNKIKGGQWCKYCKGFLCENDDCSYCFDRSLASHENKEILDCWNYEKNKVKPRNVLKFSSVKYYFNCNKCKHELYKASSQISNGNWCKYCAKNGVLCESEDCKICFNKSFASYEKKDIIECWDYEKNKGTPRDYKITSKKKIFFKCKECNHSFDNNLDKIVLRNDWCPYCSHHRICEVDKNCDYCINNLSFYSFEDKKKVESWNYELNSKSPKEVFKNTLDKYWFNCFKCKHIFEAPIAKITGIQKCWCNYCGNRMLCDKENCDICFNKSFASFDNKDKLDCWDYEKNKKAPREVFKSSSIHFYFKCSHGHSFNSVLYSISGKNRTWCPDCKNKTEKILYDFLREKFLNVESQFKAEWCKSEKTNKYYPFDFLLEDYKIIIELDGEQHFKQVGSWKSPEHTRKRDIHKMKKANENGYTIIRLLQDDVYYNKNNWDKELLKMIKKYDEPELVFISEGNEYEYHISDL
jgi:very-short-patch-repair endonuclease